MNKFNHIVSKNRTTAEATLQTTNVKGKPECIRLGKEAFDTLTALLALEQEYSTSTLGVFVANSTKRNILRQVEELFKP